MPFNDEKREYIIEDMYPKRPLMSFLWNDEYIAVINQFGFGKERYSAENNFQHDFGAAVIGMILLLARQWIDNVYERRLLC